MNSISKLLLSITAFCLVACEGNINISSENSSRNEKSITSNSTTITNGDTSSTKSDHKEEGYSENKNKTNLNYNLKDNTGITDQLEKKLRRENNDSTPPQTENQNNQKPNSTSNGKLQRKIVCQKAISDDDFEDLKGQIDDAFMDSDKVKKAKSLFNQNCITSKQARELSLIFMMDDARLEMAKFTYGRTLDKANFISRFSKVFSFSKNYDLLEEYISEE